MHACEALDSGECRCVRHLRALSQQQKLGRALWVRLVRLLLPVCTCTRMQSCLEDLTDSKGWQPDLAVHLSNAGKTQAPSVIGGIIFPVWRDDRSFPFPLDTILGLCRQHESAVGVCCVACLPGARWCHMVLPLGPCRQLRACLLLLWHTSRLSRCLQATETTCLTPPAHQSLYLAPVVASEQPL